MIKTLPPLPPWNIRHCPPYREQGRRRYGKACDWTDWTSIHLCYAFGYCHLQPYLQTKPSIDTTPAKEFCTHYYQSVTATTKRYRQLQRRPAHKARLLPLAYTFVRTNELRFMQWNEVDWQGKLWRIPAERMKMNRPHIVPLAPQVLDILKQIKDFGLSDTYVFLIHHASNPIAKMFLPTHLKDGLSWCNDRSRI